MVGIGKWSGKVSTMFFKVEAVVEIRDNNGEYEILFEPPEKFKSIKVSYHDVHAIGNTLYGKGEVSAFPGKTIEVEATFDGDKMTGKIILPFLGNKTVEIKDGHRIV